MLAQSSNGADLDNSSFKSLSCNKIALFKSTAIISPGPKAPFSTTADSSIGIIPASDPAIRRLSAVTTYRIGLNPLRSRPAATQRPSVMASAAGPSQGSITELQYAYIFCHFFGISTVNFDQLSGTIMVFAIGTFLPPRTIISNTASNAAESEEPLGAIGLISSAKSPKAAPAMRISWLFIQFRFPFRVFISPL